MKLLIFIVVYDSENKIIDVIERIPRSLSDNHELTLLVIDDCSRDRTWNVVCEYFSRNDFWMPSVILRNPVNQGYGGNQKIGYKYAIDNDYDVVALLHGDGQYAPELLPDLLQAFQGKKIPGAVFGSRMLSKGEAIRGGMPYYKFLGNKVLTTFQNLLLGSKLSEFHTGYRLYSVDALEKIPFDLNSNHFLFDTEIIVQLFFLKAKVIELPIPTHYGNEVCHVNGFEYAWDVTKESIKARMIDLGIFFDPKYVLKKDSDDRYVDKLDFFSTHSVAYDLISEKSKVLDLGCAEGHLSSRLYTRKYCEVISVDVDEDKKIEGCTYVSCDLEKDLPNIDWDTIDVIILLDIIEHLSDPELFLSKLRAKLSANTGVKIIASSGNVCFFITRIMMFLGQFNYGLRGILDIAHKRLFTVKSLKRTLRYGGYDIQSETYIPAPYPLALGMNKSSAFLIWINKQFAKVLPGLFAYQALYEIKPRPDIGWLLEHAIKNSSSHDTSQ